MTQLTKIIQPSKIFMGEKDFQQLVLVKRYIEKKFRSKVIICKTIRDNNKLALSSRNFLLSKNALIKGGKIARSLISFKKKLSKKKKFRNMINLMKNELEKKYNIHIEYLELRNSKNLNISSKTKNTRLFIAYYMNKVRLIDNF